VVLCAQSMHIDADAQCVKSIHYRVKCGFPSPAADYTEDSLNLSEYLGFDKPSVFTFSVSGESMINAGILDGDKVIIDRALTPKNGDVVVAVVDAEYTLKRLVRRADGRFELHAENPAFKPIQFAEGQSLEVWGVLIGVIRKCG